METLNSREFLERIDKELFSGKKNIQLTNIACTGGLPLSAPDKITIQFYECIFEQGVSVDALKDGSEMIFSWCTFKGTLEISYSKEPVTFKVLHSQLLHGFSIYESEKITLFMGGSQGKGEFLFDNNKFDYCSFEGFLSSETSREDNMSFLNAHFTKSSFRDAVLPNACFNNAVFDGDATFDRSTLHYNITLGAGNFFNVLFNEGAYFNGTDFTKGAMFNGSTFKNTTIFLGCNHGHLDCTADFSGSRFEKRSFFDSSRFKVLVLKQVEFSEVVSFASMYCGELKLSKTVFLQYADFLDVQIQTGSRDTFRAIKNEFLRHNNSVEALVYQARELRIYENSLTWKQKPKEKIVLFLNKISNDFGTNWVRGLIFTVTFSIFFFIVYTFSLPHFPVKFGWSSWQSFFDAINISLKYFFKFFIITHDLEFMREYGSNAYSYFIDSIARIFIGYGIYQTVAAFRKYGK